MLTSQAQDGGLFLENAPCLVAQRVDLLRVQEERPVVRRPPLPRVQQLPQHRLQAQALFEKNLKQNLSKEQIVACAWGEYEDMVDNTYMILFETQLSPKPP